MFQTNNDGKWPKQQLERKIYMLHFLHIISVDSHEAEKRFSLAVIYPVN